MESSGNGAQGSDEYISQSTSQDAATDQLHPSLSSEWASFLATQYCAREVDILRKALNEHIKHAALQHERLSAAVAQSSFNSNPPASLVTGTNLQGHLQSMRREMMESMSQLSRKLTAHEERAENLRSLASDDINAVQEKYLSALELIEYLQGELREMRSEKAGTDNKLAALERQNIDTDSKLTALEHNIDSKLMASEQDTDAKLASPGHDMDAKFQALEHDINAKLTALGHRVSALAQPSRQLSDDAVSFVEQLLSQRDELIRVTMTASPEEVTQVQQDHRATIAPGRATRRTNIADVGNTASASGELVEVPAKSKQQKNMGRQNQPNMAATRIQPKRKAAEPPQTQPDPKRVVSKPRQPAKPTAKAKANAVLTDSQDTKQLYLKFRNRYDANPPLDQVRGIWRFINQIKNPDLAKHLQESLALSLPEYVRLGKRGRVTTQIGGPQRIFVTISVHMTWKRFAEAFDRYAAMYLKE